MSTTEDLSTRTDSANSEQRASSNSFVDKNEPDADAIKMFCGQIPRHMHESELREMFEQFGSVFQLNVLRDKQTGESKGCCFVTFYSRKSALEAQNALHNLRTLSGSHHPIQMKPADTENRNERKLFVGMISKNFDEQQIRNLFQSYGTIEDCTVLRDGSTKSRGCAFITFQKRQCAVNAIKSMHHSQTMDGCSSPIVVKFADTPKDKETRKLHQQYVNHNPPTMTPFTPANNLATSSPFNLIPDLGNLMMLQQILKNYGFINNAGNSNAINVPALTNFLQMFANGGKLPLMVPTNSSSNINLNSPHGGNLQDSSRPGIASNTNPGTYNNDPNLFVCSSNPVGIGSVHQHQNGNSNGPLPPSMYTNSTSSLSNNGADTHHNLQNLVAMSQINSGGTFPLFPSTSFQTPHIAGKHNEGPDGANLFIYHLPQEFTDNDLVQAFAPYGNLISGKVFVDKTTNRSKCFGFVSYDNPNSAQTAIFHMNGAQIGSKRLKVQLKKHRPDSMRNATSPSAATVNISTENSTSIAQNYSY